MSENKADLEEVLLDFVNAVESACVNVRRYLKQEKGEKPKASFDWDPERIEWVWKEGSKGKYQRSEDVNNLEFKKLLIHLARSNGALRRNGYFYWTFKNGHMVGRKRKGKS